MNLERIALNLLRLFDTVFEERDLLLASRRLHLSQSAVSHAPTWSGGRLRHAGVEAMRRNGADHA